VRARMQARAGACRRVQARMQAASLARGLVVACYLT